MLTAKAFGMKVTQYFVGFGPTLWSFKPGRDRVRPQGHPARRLLQDRRDDAAGRRRRPGRRAARDVAVPGLEADDRDVRRLGHPLRPGRDRHLAGRLFMPACPTRSCPAPRPRSARSRRSSSVEVRGPGRTPPRECATARPGQPRRAGRAARRRPDHRDQRHAVNDYGAAGHDRLRALKPGDTAHDRVRPRRPARPRPSTCSRRPSARRWTTRTAPRSPVAALGVGARAQHRRPGASRTGRSRRFGATADFTGDLAVGTFEALKRIPREGPRPVDRHHRRRARHGHPDQRGRRQPARRRGAWRTAPGCCSSCSSSR